MEISTVNLKRVFWITTAAIIILVILGYEEYRYWQLYQTNTLLVIEINELRQSVTSVTADLLRSKSEASGLVEVLQTEQNKNAAFEAQIEGISQAVRAIQKLSSADQELLKKYSKVYFLNENYVPTQLTSIDSRYIYNKSKPQLIHTGVLPYLNTMLGIAEHNGIKMQIVSAYRSFYDQVSVKIGYKISYGTGANKFSADQGYSEHQLGTTVDFTTPEIDNSFSKFVKTDAYKWLNENAYRFGFMLSYPQNNLYYQFEPWHWRFIGINLATKLHNENKYFYDLSQQEINQYLISIFD
ncbi:MAG: M15 family metallopeptidase [Candidatus Harrisonbacteria bacterium]|nr:M15 family metallopeptidase [Candidatus Harrisonbacteria bacterium]